MKIKRFTAKNMREAIRQVREEQGPDAVILSNRRINGGIEVVAAVDYDEALMQQSLRKVAPATEPKPAEPEPEKFKSAAPPPPPAPAPRTSEALQVLLAEYGDEAPVPKPTRAVSAASNVVAAVRPVVSPAAVAMPAAKPAVTVKPQMNVPAPGPVSLPASETKAPVVIAPSAPSEEFLQLKKEIGGMRRMIEQQLAGLAWSDLKNNRPQRFSVLRVLSDLGLEPELARSIADEIPPSTTVERSRFLPLGLLARRIPVTKPDVVLEGGIIALVGATGVGKTTTIAKLAARYAERHGLRDIALVAMDHYRIGAQEQLYTYGRLIGVPVYTVTPQQSLAETLNKLADRKLVLIDTVGMSPRDGTLAAQIKTLVQAHSKLRIYLTMAANSQACDQLDVVRRFGGAQLAGCILSKIDETSRLGSALSVAVRHGLPLAYFADGQRVPEDLHVARSDQLVIRAMQLARLSPSRLDDDALAMQHATSAIEGAQVNV